MHRVTLTLVLLATFSRLGLTFEEADLKSSPPSEHELPPFTTDELAGYTEDSRTNQGISSPNYGTTQLETNDDRGTTEEKYDEQTTQKNNEENPLAEATKILEDAEALLNDEPQSTEKNMTDGLQDKIEDQEATVTNDTKEINEQSDTLSKLAEAVSDVTTEKSEKDDATKTYEEVNETTTVKSHDQTTEAEQKHETTEVQIKTTVETKETTTATVNRETSEAANTSEKHTTESSENQSTIVVDVHQEGTVTEISGSPEDATTVKSAALPTIIGPTIAVTGDKKPDEEIQVTKKEESPVAGGKPDGDKVDIVKSGSEAEGPKWEKKTEEPNKKGKSMAGAADSLNNTKENEPAQHESTVEDTKTAGPSKDTTILVFLFVAVVIVGAIAFGYNFVKKRKQRSNELERVERGQSSFKRSLQSLTKQEPEQEMKPLIKEQEMVLMKKSNSDDQNKPNGEPSAPAKT